MIDVNNKYGTGKTQLVLLEMLKDFHEFCMENDIKYSLCGGSLLGAIRHNGFIPWDDDVDIMLDRNNYNKLIAHKNKLSGYTFEQELWIYRIRRQREDNKKNVPTIDIFVMDNCPDHSLIRKVKLFLIQILQGMMHDRFQPEEYSGLYKWCLGVTYLIGKPFSIGLKFKLYMRISQIGNNKESKYVTGYNDLFNLLKLKYKSNLLNKTDLHIFEDTELMITNEWDMYLTTQYGDYMTPPPEEERIPIHN